LPLPTITHRPVPAVRRGSGDRARHPPSRRCTRAIIALLYALAAPPHRRTAAPPHRRTATPPHRRTAAPSHATHLLAELASAAIASAVTSISGSTHHNTSRALQDGPSHGAPHASFRTARLRPLHCSPRTARPCSAAAIALSPCEPCSRFRCPLQRPSPAAQPDAPELKMSSSGPVITTLSFPPAARLARPSASAAQHALECVHGPTAEISSARKGPAGAQRAVLRTRDLPQQAPRWRTRAGRPERAREQDPAPLAPIAAAAVCFCPGHRPPHP
jgi:hypothetical protein